MSHTYTIKPNGDCTAYTMGELADLLAVYGTVSLAEGDSVTDSYLADGTELEMVVGGAEPRTIAVSLDDIRESRCFENVRYCLWAKREDGVDVLLCLGED